MKCIEHLEESCKSYPRCYGCNSCIECTYGDFLRSLDNAELAKWLCKFVVDTFAASGLEDSELEENAEQELTTWLGCLVEEENK